MAFGDLVRRAAETRGLVLPASGHPEPLATLDYADEGVVKEEAIQAFWKEQRLPGRPDPCVPAPQPRGYRTTTKRRAEARRDGVALYFPGGSSRAPGLASSALDRTDHLAVYASVAKSLARPSARALAAELSYVIVRGEAPALAVILNVKVFDAAVVRGAKQVAEALRESTLGVGAAFLYLDPSGSDYYLEARRPAGVLSFKRLFGPEWLEVNVDGVRLRFPPTAFSQVNGPMLPSMVAAVRDGLGPLGGRHLLDLYCGYGLFSLIAGRGAAQVTGVDFDAPAVEAALRNAQYLRAPAHFRAGRLTGEWVARLREPRTPEVALLDPPRQGTEAGVVEAVASRRPERVVHICCGTDEIPREVAAWSNAGYRLERAVPLDLFAGTANLETVLQLAPGSPQPSRRQR